MENLQGKRKSTTASVSLFTTLSESFSLEKPPAKSARNFSRGGGVGLGIVAAMTESRGSIEGIGSVDGGFFSVSPRSTPIPIVSSAKAAANFRGGLNLDCDDGDEVDESSESYTCVISHRGDKSVTKRVYFDGKLNGVSEDCVAAVNTAVAGVFSASPASVGELEREFWMTDFLSSCLLCKKQLLGLDIFMYRGEKAFCSWECRDKHIRSEDYKEKCRRSEAMKPLDFSASPCSSPQVFLEGVAAA